MSFHVPNQFRLRSGRMATDDADGNNGAFYIQLPRSQYLSVIASDGLGWEHVSVSRKDRCPIWEEMCAIKNLFWDAEDAVMQLHPPRSEWVNNYATCLHLWRPTEASIPLPDSLLVGIKGVRPEQIKVLA